jgi:hypothetical protein
MSVAGWMAIPSDGLADIHRGQDRGEVTRGPRRDHGRSMPLMAPFNVGMDGGLERPRPTQRARPGTSTLSRHRKWMVVPVFKGPSGGRRTWPGCRPLPPPAPLHPRALADLFVPVACGLVASRRRPRSIARQLAVTWVFECTDGRSTARKRARRGVRRGPRAGGAATLRSFSS